METLLFEVNDQPYIIHVQKSDDGFFFGDVYQGISWVSLAEDGAGWSYISKIDGSAVGEANEEARIMFGFTYNNLSPCYGQLHFMDDEYSTKELPIMVRLWEQIESELRKRMSNPITT